ncbi:hypothetical protein [Flavobacterium kingsejongi]|uniref:Uncharacterized protein n=1 Tax=Flavobacterium kingsejongi TaxID=1678728 RepID=A0A2S1LPQ7_9FLAO|nr:hypothetical protein [Flavobacterium kingsejongi]AWG25626.1 hypothetical protein FK004_10480 [Flavobacterium kingsejongi]
MKINPKTGIDKLIFGMKQEDVTKLYGKPSRTYKDEEENIIYLYNDKKLRITFYTEEDLKLGYIIASDPSLQLFDKKIIGRNITEVQEELKAKGLTKWEKEDFDTYENFFNEAHWTILQTEFNEVIKVEIGAVFNDKDEFDWKFKK